MVKLTVIRESGTPGSKLSDQETHRLDAIAALPAVLGLLLGLVIVLVAPANRVGMFATGLPRLRRYALQLWMGVLPLVQPRACEIGRIGRDPKRAARWHGPRVRRSTFTEGEHRQHW